MVLIVYMLTLAILAPACGRLSDVHGRRRPYVRGIVVFTLCSLLCGLAADVTQLIGP